MSDMHVPVDALVVKAPDILAGQGRRCASASLAERLVQRRTDLAAWTRAAEQGRTTVTRGEVTAAWSALVDDAVIARRAGTCPCPRHLAEESSLRAWVVLERLLLAAAESVCAAPTRSATRVALRFVDAALVVLDEMRDHATPSARHAPAPLA